MLYASNRSDASLLAEVLAHYQIFSEALASPACLHGSYAPEFTLFFLSKCLPNTAIMFIPP